MILLLIIMVIIRRPTGEVDRKMDLNVAAAGHKVRYDPTL